MGRGGAAITPPGGAVTQLSVCAQLCTEISVGLHCSSGIVFVKQAALDEQIAERRPLGGRSW